MANQVLTLPNPLQAGDSLTISVTPATQPPPTKTPSASGTTLVPGGATPIIDSSLATWSFGGVLDARGNVIQKDGSPFGNNAGKSLLYFKGVLYTQTASGSWWTVVDGVKQAGDPRGGTPVPNPNPNPAPAGVLAAFVGAQGGGAMSLGGRGGRVIEVTNLNDGGPGSLRDALNQSGPRTIVFRVAGLITQQSDVTVTNPLLTIAGQTAPGQIILGGRNCNGFTLRISCSDTVVRYITFSPDNPGTNPGPDTGTVGYALVNGHLNRNMLDHCSMRWAGNKAFIAEANFLDEYYSDFTMQWCLVYEPHEGHPVAISMSTLSSGLREALCKNMDFHHNMLVNHSHRIPECGPASMRWINNYTYNWAFYALEMLGATATDVLSNAWVAGNLNANAQKYVIHSDPGNTGLDIQGTPSFCIDNNIGPGSEVPNLDQIAELTHQITGENGPEVNGHFPPNWLRRAQLLASNVFPIIRDILVNKKQLEDILTPNVGNSRHLDLHGNWVSHRDKADTRIINQVKSKGPGGFWPNGVTFDGQASFPAPLPDWQDSPVLDPAGPYPSQNHNGLSDVWVQSMGLDPATPNLHNHVMPDGYTALEWFLAGRSS